jgi:hypothetical protein
MLRVQVNDCTGRIGKCGERATTKPSVDSVTFNIIVRYDGTKRNAGGLLLQTLLKNRKEKLFKALLEEGREAGICR